MPAFLEQSNHKVGKMTKGMSTRKGGPVTKRRENRMSDLHIVKILVGSQREEFLIPRRLLASCEYFLPQLNITHDQIYPVLRLDNQCPSMFRLFECWLSERKSLSRFIDTAETEQSREELHWDLVNLQLFAASIGEAALQDVAMDALQDLYLRCNWEIDIELVEFVYTECDPETSYCLRNLRRWIVAMIAWGMGDEEHGGILETMFGECAGLKEEYDNHLTKVAASKLDVDLKNPQLRLPSNHLRNEERQFGYRQCSFHTHRSTIGQGRCPHVHSPTRSAYSPLRDGYVESDSDRSESRFGSRKVSPIEITSAPRKGGV